MIFMEMPFTNFTSVYVYFCFAPITTIELIAELELCRTAGSLNQKNYRHGCAILK